MPDQEGLGQDYGIDKFAMERYKAECDLDHSQTIINSMREALEKVKIEVEATNNPHNLSDETFYLVRIALEDDGVR